MKCLVCKNECDNYNEYDIYILNMYDCMECTIAIHKECLKSLLIQYLMKKF